VAVIGIRHQRQRGHDSHAGHPAPYLADYFLAGCGVGNSIAVLPLPAPGASQSLEELVRTLRRIDVAEDELAPLLDALTLGEERHLTNENELKGIVERYVKAMNDLPGIVRSRRSEAAFVWFKLGELLYRAASLQVVQGSEAARAPSDSPELQALELLAERHELPRPLRERVKACVAASRRGADPGSQYKSANEIAQSAHALLR
jgi:hypothetical protein